MKRRLLLLAVFLGLSAIMILSQAAVAGENLYAGYSRYELKIHADPANRLLTGSQQVRLINKFLRPLDKVYFFLNNTGKEPNPYLPEIINDIGYDRGFDPGYTEIKRVTDENGHELTFSFLPHTEFVKIQKYSMDEAVFCVQLRTPLAPGEKIVLNIDFEVIVPQVVSFSSLADKWYYQETFILRDA